MEENELLDLCQPKVRVSFQIIPSPYWTAEIYSFGKYIREYGYYPFFLPLCVYTDHGPGYVNPPLLHELESDAPAQFYHSPLAVREWRKIAKKPCYNLYSPAVFYRRKNKITTDPEANGTIAFYAHSTQDIDNISNIETYAKQLLALPNIFQPVSVCLHMHDVNKGKYKVFMKYGIPVYTAGNGSDYRFIERFYEIIRKFKYATSDIVGSYLYYAVEMGIPFFIFGEHPIFENKGNIHFEIGALDFLKVYPEYLKTLNLFVGLFETITNEQRQLVERDLGIRNGISRWKMARVLYMSFLRFIFSSRGFKYTVSCTSKRIIDHFKIASRTKRKVEDIDASAHY